MIDAETRILLGAYWDGELSPGEALAMEHRLSGEPDLRVLSERLSSLSASVQIACADVPVPDGLETRVLAHIGADVAPQRVSIPSWQRLAASLLIGVAIGGVFGAGGMYILNAPVPRTRADMVLAAHLRSLAAPQPFDIASSDRHVVKPWFNGRTTVAPDAPDLTAEGFPLVGGRIDVVDGKTVPTMVYRSDRHMISVTVVPKVDEASSLEDRRDGSNLESWDVGDLRYWAVSDLNTKDLRRFVDLFRVKTGQRT